MPNAIIKVTLSGSDGLDIDLTGNPNRIKASDSATITWHLTGQDADHGSFNAIGTNSDTSGFSWISNTAPPPPAGVFSTPLLSENGKKITITDNNTAASSAGSWIYKLVATVGDQTYSTTTSPHIEASTAINPRIQNL